MHKEWLFMKNELMKYIIRRTDVSWGNQRGKTWSSKNSTYSMIMKQTMWEIQLRNHKPGQFCFLSAYLLTWFLFFHLFTINLKVSLELLAAILFFSSSHLEMPSTFQEVYPQKFWKADSIFITRKSRQRLSRGHYLVSRLLSCLHCTSLVWHKQNLKLSLCWKPISFLRNLTGNWWTFWSIDCILFCNYWSTWWVHL